MIYGMKFAVPERRKGIPGREKYQIEHQAGLTLLAYGLYREYGLEFPDLPGQIRRSERGKPYLPDYPHIYFNISHSGGMAVCALGNRPLGVDAEQIRPAKLRTTRRMLTEGERIYLEACPEGMQDREFFRIWTLKESYAKALGMGLALDFTQVEFSFSGPANDQICMKRLEEEAGQEAAAWDFTQTMWEDEYVISFCGPKETAPQYSRIIWM